MGDFANHKLFMPTKSESMDRCLAVIREEASKMGGGNGISVRKLIMKLYDAQCRAEMNEVILVKVEEAANILAQKAIAEEKNRLKGLFDEAVSTAAKNSIMTGLNGATHRRIEVEGTRLTTRQYQTLCVIAEGTAKCEKPYSLDDIVERSTLSQGGKNGIHFCIRPLLAAKLIERSTEVRNNRRKAVFTATQAGLKAANSGVEIDSETVDVPVTALENDVSAIDNFFGL